MTPTRLIIIASIVTSLIACDTSVDSSQLYRVEQSQLDERLLELTEWAEELVESVAQNDRDLSQALDLVEAEQTRELSTEETTQFNTIQLNIENRSSTLTELFDQGNILQLKFFTQIYHYLGKLDAGAKHCGLDEDALSSVELAGLPDKTAWPEFEQAYTGSLSAGQNFLTENKNYPCTVFASSYEQLHAQVRDHLLEVNYLLQSLRP